MALNNENVIYIEQKFGGHLGFYEGGFIYSNPLTWQDRILVKIGHALTMGYSSTKVNTRLYYIMYTKDYFFFKNEETKSHALRLF